MTNLRPLILLAVGFGLLSLSRSLELRGDLAPIVEGGVSAERAQYHIAALVLLLGALGFFIAAGLSIWRNMRR